MQQHDELNTLLARRAVPQPRADLAERIIHAAISKIQDSPRAMSLWNELLSVFAIPHPSVVVATGIILGVVIGAQAGDGLFILQQDWSSFLYVNEGGWL
jgi:hypothetical protein